MYAHQPYSFLGSYLPGGPIVASPVPFPTEGVQFSLVGFPGTNHTQLSPVTYVRDECLPTSVRSADPLLLRDKDVSRIRPVTLQPVSTRSRHGSTVSLATDVQARIPTPRGIRTGTECLHQEE